MMLVQKLHEDARLPECAHPGSDLGYDLFALEDSWLEPGYPVMVRTGIAAQYTGAFTCPYSKKYGLLIRDRSSMAARGVYVVGGVLDAEYTGEIRVVLLWGVQPSRGYAAEGNHQCSLRVCKGDRIAQMIPIPVMTGDGLVEVPTLPSSDRGANGFGSTGR